MPHPEKIPFVENTHPSSERNESSPLEDIREDRTEVEADSARSQEAAKQEAALVLERIRQLPRPSIDGSLVPEESATEHQGERLSALNQALDDLFAVAKYRSPSKFTLGEKIKILVHNPKDFFVEKKALNDLEQGLPLLEEDICSPEHRGAALQLIERMANGMDDNEQIKSYVIANGKLKTKLVALAEQALTKNTERFVSSLEMSAAIDTMVPKILSGELSGIERLTDYPDGLLLGDGKLSEAMGALMIRLAPFIETQVGMMSQERGIYSASLDQYLLVLRPLVLSDDQEVSRHARDQVVDIFMGGDSPEIQKAVCASYVRAGGTESEKQASREVIRSIVSRMGLDEARFYDADKYMPNRASRQSVEGNYVDNIVAAQALERSAAGSVKKLVSDYGILTFARYPKDVLLKQIEKEEDTESPYGVVLYPREDWNGAFYGSPEKFSELASSGEVAGMNVRIFECEGKIDAVKKLIALNRKYGSHQKISFALVGGHGNSDAFSFGVWDKNRVFKGDLTGHASEELRKFFDEEATLVLNACSTGGDLGIGEMMSRLHAIKVIAPDVPTALRSIRVDRKEGHLVVSVGYRQTEDGSNALRHYNKGALEVGERSQKWKDLEELLS